MPKRKRGVTGDAARRQQAIRNREKSVPETDEERNRRLSTMAQRGQTEEQNNSRLNDALFKIALARYLEVTIFALFNSQFFRCLKEKEKLQGILRVDSGQLGNVKGELLKLTKKETADCQLWHNVFRTEETEEQNNSRLTVMAQRVQERKAEETEEQRNTRLSDMAQRSQERRAEENRRTKK
ncbi:hypothetical protein AVEN_17727-1 [Araneus ventricosus]|uniref:STPR domain-containing protein n=1 Tax=Araneus ventricosus TaxID=182803 RepID=A0A4Y2F9V4_ARAVE|nr:hypothetical protein AVEN_17727-1 [Araneus ventricosus]